VIVEMAQDYASADESLGDFIVEDETGTCGKEASLGYSEIDVEEVAPTISVRIYLSTGRQAISWYVVTNQWALNCVQCEGLDI